MRWGLLVGHRNLVRTVITYAKRVIKPLTGKSANQRLIKYRKHQPLILLTRHLRSQSMDFCPIFRTAAYQYHVHGHQITARSAAHRTINAGRLDRFFGKLSCAVSSTWKARQETKRGNPPNNPTTATVKYTNQNIQARNPPLFYRIYFIERIVAVVAAFSRKSKWKTILEVFSWFDILETGISAPVRLKKGV